MPPPTAQDYAVLAFSSAVGYTLDAMALFDSRRFPGALIACQHALEMLGKASLALETGLPAWPPPRGHWIGQHRVISEIDVRCRSITITGGVRTALQQIERWLPPPVSDPLPSENTEYFFYSGGRWHAPEEYFNQYDVEPVIHALKLSLRQVQAAYPALAAVSLRSL